MKEIRTFGRLAKEGKLDQKLRHRLWVFVIISVIFGGTVLYDIISYKINPFLLLGVSLVSFVIGLFLLSRMNPVKWDEEREVMMLGKMDVVGVLLIIAYVVFRVISETMITEYFKSVITVSGVTYAFVFGLMFGRLCGILVMIHKVHERDVADFGN